MNGIEKLKTLGEIAKSALDSYVQLQNSIVKEYQNMEHHLMQDHEVLVPSRNESYIFDSNVWTINIIDNNIIIRKKLREKRTETDICTEKRSEVDICTKK